MTRPDETPVDGVETARVVLEAPVDALGMPTADEPFVRPIGASPWLPSQPDVEIATLPVIADAVATNVITELAADDIEWTLRPMPMAPPMTRDEMIVELAVDALAYRLIVVECFDALRQVTIERDRARAECIRLREAARR